jgi:hypothetical protein
LNKSGTVDGFGNNVKKLGNSESRGLPDIRVGIGEGLLERVYHVFGNGLRTNATHGSHSKRTDKRIVILGILDEGIDSHNGLLGFSRGVNYKVKVNKFLQFEIIRFYATQHRGEKERNVLTTTHERNTTLCGLFPLEWIISTELVTELKNFTLRFAFKELDHLAAGFDFGRFGHREDR